MIAFASLFLGLVVGVLQRIVWVQGRYLPQEIALSDKAKGLELAR